MRTNRATKESARRLREALQAIGRVFCLRDPLASALGADISPAQVHAIVALGNAPAAMGELGRRLSATGPTITGIVDRLEVLGIVERRRSTTDRRVVTLHLTKRGRTLHERFELALEDRLGGLLGLLDLTDRRALVGIFERLAARVSADVVTTPACRGLDHAQH